MDRTAEIRKATKLLRAIDTLTHVCRTSKLNYTVRVDHNGMNTVKVLAKNFCSMDLFEAYKKAIFYVAVAENYMTRETLNTLLNDETQL